MHFPDATSIVDKYHSREPLRILAGKVYPQDEPSRKRWIMVEQDKLDEGKIEEIVATLRCPEAAHSGFVEDIEKEGNYFEANQERMRYAEFRKQGLFVGSGVIEAGCKTVIGRLKRSGMFWTVRGANAIIALRSCQLSGQFEHY